MLIFQSGNLLESDAQTLVNTVNCRGVMGKGIAHAFKRRFPKMFKDYVRRCKAREVLPGRPYLFVTNGQQIINFPTKDDWRRNSRLEYIESGLSVLRAQISAWHVRSLALPALGCGLGGLNWDDVKPLIEQYLGDLDIRVEVFEPTRDRSVEHDLLNAAESSNAAYLVTSLEDAMDRPVEPLCSKSNDSQGNSSAVDKFVYETGRQDSSAHRRNVEQPLLFKGNYDHESFKARLMSQASPPVQAGMLTVSGVVERIQPSARVGKSLVTVVLLDDGTSLKVGTSNTKFLHNLSIGDQVDASFAVKSLTSRSGDFHALALRLRDGAIARTSGRPGNGARRMVPESPDRP